MNGNNSEAVEPRVNQLEVNKVIRILNSNRQKYTVHLLMKDGSERQLQSNHLPKVDYSSDARDLLLVIPVADTYTHYPVCPFSLIDIIQVEENPT